MKKQNDEIPHYMPSLGHPSIIEFIEAMGLNSKTVGDFKVSINVPVQGVVSGEFHIWIEDEQFQVLKDLAPEFRRNALFKLMSKSGETMEIPGEVVDERGNIVL